MGGAFKFVRAIVVTFILSTVLFSLQVNGIRECFRSPEKGANQIFFLKTSCVNFDGKGNTKESQLKLTNEMVCAIESAARANPDMLVYLYQPCPIERNCIKNSRPLVKKLFETHENVFIFQEAIDKFVADTPIEEGFKKIYSSTHFLVQVSDLMRYTILYRFGGIYLDTDFITRRSFEPLKGSYLAVESSSSSNGAAMAMQTIAGHLFITEALNYSAKSFGGLYQRSQLGPLLVDQVLKSFCPMEKIKEVSAAECNGITVLNRTTFYPIHYSEWWKCYTVKEHDEVMKRVNDSFAVHLWNGMKKKSHFGLVTEVNKTSIHAVATLQKEFCPLTYADSTEESKPEPDSTSDDV